MTVIDLTFGRLPALPCLRAVPREARARDVDRDLRLLRFVEPMEPNGTASHVPTSILYASQMLSRRPRSAKFERLGHDELTRIADTSTMRDGDDIPGVGRSDGQALVTYHVTDNPDVVIALVKRRGRLMAAYGERGRSSELGPGLYVSGNPQYWISRAHGKWDFLKRLSASEQERLVHRLRQDVEELGVRNRLSTSEYERGLRDLGYVANGTYDPSILTMFANQPYNIKFWQPEYLEELRIAPGKNPRLLEVRVRGQFAQVSRSHPDHALLRTLRRGRVSGAFTRAGMSTNPEMVIWDPKAIVSVREVDIDS